MPIQNLQETSIMASFSTLPDPRKNRNQTYSLFDIVTVTILAVLCGADDWVEANQVWLQQREICPNSIPSHDTFSRFLEALSAKFFCYKAQALKYKSLWQQRIVHCRYAT